jgi:hypothetical protein
MGWLDKLLGRGKKAESEMKGESSMQREGMREEPAAPSAPTPPTPPPPERPAQEEQPPPGTP